MPTEPSSTDAPQNDSLYPEVEAFIERATEDDIRLRFDSLKAGLEGLKGARATHAKRVLKALDHVEALFMHLLGVRTRLIAQAPKSKK
jgi:hypothetical protein